MENCSKIKLTSCLTLMARVALAGTNLELRCFHELQGKLLAGLSYPGSNVARVGTSSIRQNRFDEKIQLKDPNSVSAQS